MGTAKTKTIGDIERHVEDDRILFFVVTKKILYKKRSPYQKIVIAEIGRRGPSSKALVLNGRIELQENDEFVYHEQLVIPPLFYHPNPKNVLIIGGGDGFALREVFKDDRVEHAVLCELDEDVIQVSREYFGETNQRALDHPKLKICVGDCRETLKNLDRTYDVIIIDLVEPINTNSGEYKGDLSDGGDLHDEVCKMLPDVANEGTIVNVYAGAMEVQSSYAIKAMSSLKELFPHVHLHRTFVEAFNQEVGLVFASKTNYVETTTSEQLQQNSASFAAKLKALSHEAFPGAFYLPPYLKAQFHEQCEK